MMDEIIKKIKEHAKATLVENKTDRRENLIYIDHKIFKRGDKLDLVNNTISFEQRSYVVFIDEAPGMNWAHACHYLLYDAEKGEFIKRVDAEFPYFMEKRPKTLELFHTSRTITNFKRKKKIKVPLNPGELSTWRFLSKFPLHFTRKGRRYAIFYSGHSNCRHVNDMEFLYRTLIDVYGFNSEDIYVVNYDGTLNWNPESWEPAAPCNYPVDGTPFRLQVNDEGNRTGFQNVISDLASRMGSADCLFIHTNNHGGYDYSKNEGFMSGWGGIYYANDFASDLATLPNFNTLLVMMEPCHAGAFIDPIMLNSPASRTVVQAAVPWDEGSAGGWFFDPWAEMWISAMAGVRGDGTPLLTSADDNLDTLISAWEAFDFAYSIDNPVMDESSVDLSENVFLSQCELKGIEKLKEYDKMKEFDKIKEIKEFDKIKEIKEVKEFDKIKDYYEYGKMYETGQLPYRQTGPGLEHTTPQIYTQYQEQDIGNRIARLEAMFDKLSPFIESKSRPNLKKSAHKKEKQDKK